MLLLLPSGDSWHRFVPSSPLFCLGISFRRRPKPTRPSPTHHPFHETEEGTGKGLRIFISAFGVFLFLFGTAKLLYHENSADAPSILQLRPSCPFFDFLLFSLLLYTFFSVSFFSVSSLPPPPPVPHSMVFLSSVALVRRKLNNWRKRALRTVNISDSQQITKVLIKHFCIRAGNDDEPSRKLRRRYENSGLIKKWQQRENIFTLTNDKYLSRKTVLYYIILQQI